MHNRKNRFKIYYAVGYVLRNIETIEFRYYHPSNYGLFLNTAWLISNREELMDFLNTISKEYFFDNVSRPDTKWKIYQATNILFFVHNLKNAPLGGDLQLPNYIKFTRGLAHVSGENDLCFFRCLAVFKGADLRRCETVCRELFSHFWSKYPVDVFPGIDFNDLPQIEDLFKINIVIWQHLNVAKLVQKRRELYDETMRLKLYQNHLSLSLILKNIVLSIYVLIVTNCGTRELIFYVIVQRVNSSRVKHTQEVYLNLRKLFLKNLL